MKNVISFLITLVLIISIGVTGCKKDYYKDYIIGKWKLERVYSYDSAGYLNFSVLKDYSKDNIVYEFQKNNKLFVTSSISGISQTKKYSYKCEDRETFCGTFGVNVLVKVGKETYYTYLGRDVNSFEFETMSISSNFENVMFEVDRDISKQTDRRSWQKKFIKLK